MKERYCRVGFSPLASLATVLMLVSLFWSGEAAGLMIPQSVEQLTGNSTHIVRARVLSMQAQWNPSHTYIYTTVTLRTSESFKGNIGGSDTISVFVPGGEVRDTGLAVEHAPQFDIAQEVLVFLTQHDDLYTVTSGEQGKFTVVADRIAEKRIPVAAFVNEINKAMQR